MNISVVNLQKKIRLNSRQIIQYVKAVLKHEKIGQADLSVVFVNDRKIRALNKKFLKHDFPTDVLSFGGEECGCSTHGLNGEIVISTETALRQSKIYQTTAAEELSLYIIHGILHLLGSDDRRSQDKRKMRRKESELLSFLKKKNIKLK